MLMLLVARQCWNRCIQDRPKNFELERNLVGQPLCGQVASAPPGSQAGSLMEIRATR